MNADLAAELAEFANYQDDSCLNLAETLQRLAQDAKLAVDSYLGLSVEITADGQQLTLSSLGASARPADIRTSLLLRLTPAANDRGDAPLAVSVILYAGIPGAFVDLGADLDWMTGRRLSTVILDQHLPFSPAAAEHQSLRAVSALNQAIGALIGSGHTAESADRELHALAERAGIDRVTAAQRLLESLDDG